MNSRRWLALVFGVLLAAVAATLYALPELLRQLVVSRVQAITDRQVSIDGVDLKILTGQLTVRGFRLAERGGGPFADFERLDIRLHIPSLLRGHLWIQELVLRNSTVRVVRLPTNEFNLSDLIRSSGTPGRTFDVTVDRFALVGGTVTLEDRALPEWRTWASENIVIEARNVSTRRDDGTAVGTSVTAGAPVSLEMEHLRLYPIHLQATVTVEGLDLGLARLYLPPDAPVVLDRGRASTSVKVALDARDGLRVDATGRFDDVALVRPGRREPVALAPTVTAQLAGFAVQPDGGLRLGRLEIAGSANVLDPGASQAARFELTSVRASIADLTWPVTTPGRVQLLSSVPGGGRLAVAGTLRPPPASTQLRLRLTDLDLAPWVRFLPLSARIAGVAEADLQVNEPLAAGVPARVQGSIAVKRFGVRDAGQELLGAQRVEATGLEVHWPARLIVKRLLVSGPRGIVERDRAGGFPAQGLWSRSARAPAPTSAVDVSAPAASTAPALGVEIGKIEVRDGAVAWRDEAVAPPARLDLSRVEATVTGVGWPLRGPVDVRVALRPPRGGQFQLAGRVGLDPLTADLRLAAKDADLAPYQAYLPTAARINGWADLDLSVLLPPGSEGRATVRGNATLSRVDIRDGERTVMKVERAGATGLDVEWPQRIAVSRLALQRPWLLLERDETGGLPLRALLTPTPRAGGGAPTANADPGGGRIAVALRRVTVDDGGVRVVDRGVSPSFAVDLERLALQTEGLSTAPAKPAHVELTGRVGAVSDLALRGTIGPVGGPLYLDVSADLRGFAIPRANSYLLRHVAWKAREGWLTTSLRCRITGDALEARTDIRLSRLQVVRAGAQDEAQARIGLPLGLIVALMKDSRGDVHVSFPVGGRISDPRFDFTEAIWSAVRTVAVNAITLPVSWIGRVRLGPDSRIQEVQVDPIRFQPGTATLTPEGLAHVAGVVAFLEQLPEVRLALRPVVSSRDLAELRRQAVDATIDRVAREARMSSEAAAVRLFEQRFPGRQPPPDPEAILAALVESEPARTAEASELRAQRVKAVRATVKQAGIDIGRLSQTKLVERQEAVEGEIEIEIVEPDSSRRSPLREFLGRLGGTTTGTDPADE
jgi:hypothetical protein